MKSRPKTILFPAFRLNFSVIFLAAFFASPDQSRSTLESIETPEGMIYIPAGKFIMGMNAAQREKLVKEYDINPDMLEMQIYGEVDVPAFFIDKYEVTNRQYRQFVEETGHLLPIRWYDVGYSVGMDDYPIVGISYDDMEAYAEWVGKRLPTDEEWEKAARGTDGRFYVWGDRWDAAACKMDDSGSNPMSLYPAEIGSFPGDRSVYGVMDMGGNVMECVKGKHWLVDGDAGDRGEMAITRGGCFSLSEPFYFLCAARARGGGSMGNDRVGFRCAMDVPEKDEVKGKGSDSIPAAEGKITASAPSVIVPLGKAPSRVSLKPDPSQYRKKPLQIFPIVELDPQRKMYGFMSGYIPDRLTGKDALKQMAPWMLDIRVPYLPGDRFRMNFEKILGWDYPHKITFNDDFTEADIKKSFPKYQFDATIKVKCGLDYVDVFHTLNNTGNSPSPYVGNSRIPGYLELCFQSWRAPNFRDNGGSRTFIMTDQGFTSMTKIWHRVEEGLGLQNYYVAEPPLKGGVQPEGPLVATVSGDGRWVAALTCLSHRPMRFATNRGLCCLHCNPDSSVEPNETKTFQQRIYFLKGTLEDLVVRYEADVNRINPN